MLRIRIAKSFVKAAKPIIKRYASFEDDYDNLISEIRNNPKIGVDLGSGLRKVRMQIKSKGKGKSGGARVITYSVIVSDNDGDVVLLTIYDKSDISSIEIRKLKKLIAK